MSATSGWSGLRTRRFLQDCNAALGGHSNAANEGPLETGFRRSIPPHLPTDGVDAGIHHVGGGGRLHARPPAAPRPYSEMRPAQLAHEKKYTVRAATASRSRQQHSQSADARPQGVHPQVPGSISLPRGIPRECLSQAGPKDIVPCRAAQTGNPTYLPVRKGLHQPDCPGTGGSCQLSKPQFPSISQRRKTCQQF